MKIYLNILLPNKEARMILLKYKSDHVNSLLKPSIGSTTLRVEPVPPCGANLRV